VGGKLEEKNILGGKIINYQFSKGFCGKKVWMDEGICENIIYFIKFCAKRLRIRIKTKGDK